MARWLQLEKQMTTWKCTICGCVEGGTEPPHRCPECGAREAMFVRSNEPPHGIAHNPIQPHDERDQHAYDFAPGAGCIH
jgi:hypothetical protein